METLRLLAIIGAGYSIVSAWTLLVAYWFFLPQMQKTAQSRIACAAVLLGFASLQWLHLEVFLGGESVLYSRGYVTLLTLIPLSFYLFSLFVLFPKEYKGWYLLLHLLPLIISTVLEPEWVIPLAFTVGAAYTVWLAARLYSLRDQRSRFRVEMFFFAQFAAVALIALLLGFFLPLLDPQVFFLFYSLSISLAMVLVVAVLLIFPDLMIDVVAITEAAYAESKLESIDSESKLAQLRQLMQEEKIYEDETLNLSTVAELLQLSVHQVSELINRHCAENFPSFVKRYRVNAAKTLLIEEPQSSVLAISMQTGFKSQSAFYSAFKADTGFSPGAYRKKYAA